MTDGREAAREPGELVRDVWVAWAREQPDVADHASWTVAWEALSARDREVDARIEATIRRDERERASESALRAAAQALLDNDRGIGCSGCIPPEEGYHTPECLMGALSIAIAGAPYSPDMALKAAAREVMKSYEAYVALGSARGIDSAGSPPKPEDQWDEYDYMMIPAWRRLKSALDGAPWEPSEEQVERAEKAMRSAVLGAYPWEVDDWTLVARAALKAGMGIESGSAG